METGTRNGRGLITSTLPKGSGGADGRAADPTEPGLSNHKGRTTWALDWGRRLNLLRKDTGRNERIREREPKEKGVGWRMIYERKRERKQIWIPQGWALSPMITNLILKDVIKEGSSNIPGRWDNSRRLVSRDKKKYTMPEETRVPKDGPVPWVGTRTSSFLRQKDRPTMY